MLQASINDRIDLSQSPERRIESQLPLVARGSLADEAGLQPGDVLIRLNGLPLHEMTHAQAHDKLVNAGNNFVLSVVRNHLNHHTNHPMAHRQ
ncbi:PDZ and LIM domain protein Zasp isoform X2 [Cephus cinctus]|uniref:PDZ and LIM domain protein Zasp isoform X2 n=1 Tax=Cephus cinctus TaxID=211228 RepID=A0AAJ7BQC9_CEPCN|nr:PDZ and LIM domain protein Zasp isoform X2 [Cephus cinctus]